MRLLKIFFLSLSLSFLNLHAQSHDPYNAFRFNRSNWEKGSNRVENNPWYEWWYFKVVSPQGRSFYWVYGVINPGDLHGESPASRAYVEIGDFEQKQIQRKVFPVSQFQAAYDHTDVRITDSPFQATDRSLRGEMTTESGETVRWDLSLEKEWGWNAMGWGLPLNSLFDIAWYPAQASALMSGTIQWGDETIVLNQAKAYQDRNWGSDFPKWWYWLVGNEFNENASAKLACGGGMPKILGLPLIPALTCGLKVDGDELEFRSNDITLFDYDLRFGHWYLSFEKLDYKLVVTAWAPQNAFMDLVFLSPNNEEFHDFETLKGNMHLELFKRKGLDWRKVMDLTSERAGIEWGSRDPNPRYEGSPLLPDYSVQVSR